MQNRRTIESTDLADYPVIVTLPVHWHEQDLFGHVNNTHHVRWFENARIAFFEACGWTTLMTDEQVGPILASITCHYRRQLNYPDTVRIGARVSHWGHTSMTIDHVICSQNQQALVADGISVVVMFDYTRQRPVPIPDHLRQAAEQLGSRGIQPDN